MILKYSKSRIGMYVKERDVLDGEYYILPKALMKHCYQRAGDGYRFKASNGKWGPGVFSEKNLYTRENSFSTLVLIVAPE